MADVIGATAATTQGLGSTFGTFLDILKYGIPAIAGLAVLILMCVCCRRFWLSLIQDPDEEQIYEEEFMKDDNEWDNISVLGAGIDKAIKEEEDFNKKSSHSDTGSLAIDIDEGLPDDYFFNESEKLLQRRSSDGDDSGQGTSTPNKSWKRTKSMSESIEMLDLCDGSSKESSRGGSENSLNKSGRSVSKDSVMEESVKLLPAKLTDSNEKLSHIIDIDSKLKMVSGSQCYDSSIYCIRPYSHDIDTVSLTSYKVALDEGSLMTPFLDRKAFDYNRMNSRLSDTLSLKRLNSYNADTCSLKMALSEPFQMTPKMERKLSITSNNGLVRQDSLTSLKRREAGGLIPYNEQRELNRLYNLSDAEDTDTEGVEKVVHVMAEIYTEGKPILPTTVSPQEKREEPVEVSSSPGARPKEPSSPDSFKDIRTSKVKRSGTLRSSFNGSIAHEEADKNHITPMPMSAEERERLMARERAYARRLSIDSNIAIPYDSDSDSDTEKVEEKKEEPYFPKNLKTKKKVRAGMGNLFM